MSLDEIKLLLENGTINEIVQKMNEEQRDAFLKTVYDLVSKNESFTGNGTKKFEVRFGYTTHHYTGYSLEKQEIYGYTDQTSFSGSGGILADEVEVDYGIDEKISFEEAESLLRSIINGKEAQSVDQAIKL